MNFYPQEIATKFLSTGYDNLSEREQHVLLLHEKLDHLREIKWADLVEMQQEQIRLLTRLLDQRVASNDSAAG